MIRIGTNLVLALLVVRALTMASEGVAKSANVPAQDDDLIALHRSVHVYAGYCPGCHDASYKRFYICRPGHRCVEFDHGRIEAYGSATRRADRRHSLTTNRRIKCVSEHSQALS